MINLIPTEEQKNAKKGFYLRLIVVFFAMLTFCALVASVALVPSYFLVLNKERIANNKLEIQKNEEIPQLDQDTVLLIKEIDNKLKIIENSIKNRFLVSEEVFEQVIASKMSDIKIDRVVFSAEDPSLNKEVSIYGTAPSRERLLLFRKSLESNSNFSKVNLPVSNFIKGENIEFYLSLILKEK